MVTGIFSDPRIAENAYTKLQERGYSKEEINLVMPDHIRENYFSFIVKNSKTGTKISEAAVKTSTTEGSVDSVSNFEVINRESTLEAHNSRFIITGPIAKELAGGMLGGIIDGFVKLGIPKVRAQSYESGLKVGKIVIGFQPINDNDANYFVENWRANNVEQIDIDLYTALDNKLDIKDLPFYSQLIWKSW